MVSKRKQKDNVFGLKYSAIHQSSLLELKSVNIASISKNEERDNEQGPKRLEVGFSDTV